jgi:hypothetical protein
MGFGVILLRGEAVECQRIVENAPLHDGLLVEPETKEGAWLGI